MASRRFSEAVRSSPSRRSSKGLPLHVPLTADIEAGYGGSPAEVAKSVADIIAAYRDILAGHHIQKA